VYTENHALEAATSLIQEQQILCEFELKLTIGINFTIEVVDNDAKNVSEYTHAGSSMNEVFFHGRQET